METNLTHDRSSSAQIVLLSDVEARFNLSRILPESDNKSTSILLVRTPTMDPESTLHHDFFEHHS